MVRVGVVVFAACAAGAIVLACTATPTEEGGTSRFDAAPETVADDGGSVCTEDTDAGSSDTWTSLYQDYFGPTGKASCAGTGVCHGDTSQAGYQGSGYVCPPTAAQCYAGITATAAGLVTPGPPVSDPTTAGLYGVLRKCAGGGSMPKEPATVFFTAGDMARIGAWIQAGAPDDSPDD
jgi:hypothetical protein